MKQRGFTLLEVLIALAILAISLTAVLRVVNDNSQYLTYIRDKTTAHWVAQNVLARVQSGELVLTLGQAPKKGEMTLLNRAWFWNVALKATNDPAIGSILVNINADGEQDPVVSLHGYMWIAKDE